MLWGILLITVMLWWCILERGISLPSIETQSQGVTVGVIAVIDLVGMHWCRKTNRLRD